MALLADMTKTLDERSKASAEAMEGKLSALGKQMSSVAASAARPMGAAETALAGSSNFSKRVTEPAVRTMADVQLQVAKVFDGLTAEATSLAVQEVGSDKKNDEALGRIQALVDEGVKLFRALAQGIYGLQSGGAMGAAKALILILGEDLPGEKGTSDDAMVLDNLSARAEKRSLSARGEDDTPRSKRAAADEPPKCSYCGKWHRFGTCFKWADELSAAKDEAARAVIFARKPGKAESA